MKRPELMPRENDKSNNSIHVAEKNISSVYPLHWHDYFELEVITDGHGVQFLNGQKFPLKKGAAYLLTPNDFHEVICDNTISLFNIQFSAELVDENMLHRFTDPENCFFCELSEEGFQELLYLVKALHAGCTDDNDFKRNILNCILTIITNNARRIHSDTTASLTNNAVSRAKLYMNIHFKNNPSLNDIAGYLGLNRSYFSRLFYKETGETPMHYLASLKLAYAKTLLLSTSLPVTEISFICGYVSFSNFSKAFKAHFHMTPNEMRKL